MKSTPHNDLADEDLPEPLVEDWSVLVSHLPNGWEAMARETKAIQRTRGFGTPEALLRTLLIHLAEGCSLRETAVRAAEGGIANVSDVAILKRLRASEDWLRLLAVKLAVGQNDAEFPDAGGKLRIRLVDATTVREPGSTVAAPGSACNSNWRHGQAIATTIDALSCLRAGCAEMGRLRSSAAGIAVG